MLGVVACVTTYVACVTVHSVPEATRLVLRAEVVFASATFGHCTAARKSTDSNFARRTSATTVATDDTCAVGWSVIMADLLMTMAALKKLTAALLAPRQFLTAFVTRTNMATLSTAVVARSVVVAMIKSAVVAFLISSSPATHVPHGSTTRWHLNVRRQSV